MDYHKLAAHEHENQRKTSGYADRDYSTLAQCTRLRKPTNPHKTTAEFNLISQMFNILQCNHQDCLHRFSDEISWRRHGGQCRVKKRSFSCSFSACQTQSPFFKSVKELLDHQNSEHRFWACIVTGCTHAFLHKRSALGHVLSTHHEIEDSVVRNFIKQMWTPVRPQSIQFHSDSTTSFDLTTCGGADNRIGNLQTWPTEPSPLSNIQPIRGEAEELSYAVFSSIAAQMTTTKTLLSNRLLLLEKAQYEQLFQILREMEQELLKRCQEDPRIQMPVFAVGIPNTGGKSQTSPSTGFCSVQTEHVRAAPTFSPDVSPRSKVSRKGVRSFETEADGEEDEAEEDWGELSNRQRFDKDGEPLEDTHLESFHQREYFEKMQECCVQAAFTFYQKHKHSLDRINDKKGKQLCLTTQGRPIKNATDLSLPQWTHLLRRLSDAKGLSRTMVSRVESFSGEIQPVDEVRHAYSKSKLKSDRSLLALVQLTRNFCWQLKDWDRCVDLDVLYGALEKNIRLARKENLNGFQKPMRKFTSQKGRMMMIQDKENIPSAHRASFTWPRLGPDVPI